MLSTPAELAQALELSIPRLRWLAFHAEVASRDPLRPVHRSQEERRPARLQRAAWQPAEGPALGLRADPHQAPRRARGSRLPPRPQHPDQRRAPRGTAVGREPRPGGFLPEHWLPPGAQGVRMRSATRRPSPRSSRCLCTECPRRTVVFEGTTYHVATGPRGLPQGACTSPGALEPGCTSARPPPCRPVRQARPDLHPLRRRPDLLRRRGPGSPHRLPAGPRPAYRTGRGLLASTRPRLACSGGIRPRW